MSNSYFTQRGTQDSDLGVMIGRCSLDSQHGRDLIVILRMLAVLFSGTQITARWTPPTRDPNGKHGLGKTTNLHCYFKSNPTQRGYRKRIMEIWQELSIFQTTTQKLADQVRTIMKKGWFSSHDGILGFWFKRFTSIPDRLVLAMNKCLQTAHVPEWMTKGRTTLIEKDTNKGTAPNNYRPITCLPMMWKILTAQIREEIYHSLTSRGLFPEEQKGCCKGSRGTAELLYIDKHIIDESKKRRKNLAMAWIDYKKAYDMVPHSWIINSLKMYKISDEVINFIDKTMKTWRVELTAGGRKLAEAKIQRGIF